MAPFNQYNQMYDQVGSQLNHPSGYTYRLPDSSAPAYPNSSIPGYDSSGDSGYFTAYGDQRYGPEAAQQRPTMSSSHTAAAALRDLASQQDYAANFSNRSSSVTPKYPTSPWLAHDLTQRADRPNLLPGYPANLQVAPLNSANIENQSQVNSQAQRQSHQYQSSRSSNPQDSLGIDVRNILPPNQSQSSLFCSNAGDLSSSTVNPSQVYNIQAEQVRRAEAEAERRKTAEADETARKAEEDRVATKQLQAADRAKQDEKANNKPWQPDKPTEQQRRDEDTPRSKSRDASESDQESAGSGKDSGAGGQPAAATTNTQPGAPHDDESEMRAMFQKMRELNQRNPAMLARLWEEEKKAHSASQPQHGVKQVAVPAKPPVPMPTTRQPDPTTASIYQKQPETNTISSGPGSTKPTANAPLAAVSGAPTAVPVGNYPPHKKEILAETAARWLSQIPEHLRMNRSVTKKEILMVLDTHPSYVQLCETIETMGFQFDRTALATELMIAVSGGLRTQPEQRSDTPLTIVNGTASDLKDNCPALTTGKLPETNQYRHDAASHTPPSAPPPQPMTTTPSALVNMSCEVPHFRPSGGVEFNSITNPARFAPASGDSGVVQLSQVKTGTPIPGQMPRQGAQQPFQSHRLEIKPISKEKLPANKEEAARKRTFSDLVDLSTGDSDDERPMRKIIRAYFNPQMAQPQPFTQGRALTQAVPPSRLDSYHNSDPAAITSAELRSHSTQRIPSQPHEEPPTKAAQPNGPSPEQQQYARMKGAMLVEPIMHDRVARKSHYDSRTIARDVLLATGRHPDMRPLNAHLKSMDKLLGQHGGSVDGAGNKSDLSTIRWELIDPVHPSTQRVAVTDGRSAGKSAVRDAEISNEARGQGEPGQTTTGEGPHRRHTPRSSITHGNFAEPKKTRQGPRRNSPSRVLNQSSSPGANMSTSKPPRPANTTPDNTVPVVPVGYTEFRKYNENGEEIKKKGRPVGWRKHLHSREAQGLAPANTHHKKSHPAPSGLPSRLREQHSPPRPPPMQEPHYQEFKCRWRDCKAQLHNLEGLKKHIIKLHGFCDDDGRYDCRWRGCVSRNRLDGQPGSSSADTVRCPNIELWLEHVDKEHILDVAWRQGDGPKGGSLSESMSNFDSEASYLSDAQGRSVTPMIQPYQAQQDEPGGAGAAPLPCGPLFTRLAGRPRKDGLTKDERGAVAELKKLESAKAAEGACMGTEGSRLANAKRRLGFLDDEDFDDIVDSTEIGEDSPTNWSHEI